MRWMVVLMVAAGCAPSLTGVRAKAAEVLSCPNDSVTVQWLQNLEWHAQGCGLAVELRCPSRDTGANCLPASPVQPLASLSPTPLSNDPRRVERMNTADETTRAMRQQRTNLNSLTPPGNIYMPGQYNPRTGAVQRDYSHQYTTPPSYHH
jgi:hypothetical protein